MVISREDFGAWVSGVDVARCDGEAVTSGGTVVFGSEGRSGEDEDGDGRGGRKRNAMVVPSWVGMQLSSPPVAEVDVLVWDRMRNITNVAALVRMSESGGRRIEAEGKQVEGVTMGRLVVEIADMFATDTDLKAVKVCTV